jgi:DnaJ-class molecular chaperone
MDDTVDYYDILELPRDATQQDIKKKYRKLAIKYHPDKNKEDEDAVRKFQAVAEAFEVLSDPEKRAIFDQYGYEGLRDGVPDETGSMKGGYQYSQNANEIFESFFGVNNPFVNFGFGETFPFSSRLEKSKPQKPSPVTKSLPCTLEELFRGCTKRVSVTRKRWSDQNILVDHTKELMIRVKPGWKAGTKITFPNEGDESPDCLPSDLVFVIEEVAHHIFKRDGHNLIATLSLSLADALTDCSLSIPTLDHRTLSLPCPEVVSPSHERTLTGEGMPISKSPQTRGDLIIRFQIRFPVHLSDSKKAKLREILCSEDPLLQPEQTETEEYESKEA